MFSKHIKASNNNDNSNASVSFSYVSSIRAVKVSFPGETAAAAPLQSSATVKQKQLRKRSKVYHMLLDAHCSEAQLTVTSLQRRRQQGTGGWGSQWAPGRDIIHHTSYQPVKTPEHKTETKPASEARVVTSYWVTCSNTLMIITLPRPCAAARENYRTQKELTVCSFIDSNKGGLIGFVFCLCEAGQKYTTVWLNHASEHVF